MKAGTHNIDISHEDKVLFPKSKITKRKLIEYYERISDYALPWLRNRPLTLHRFPDGIPKDGFYQKDRPDYFPKWIKSVKVSKKNGTVNQVICNDKATLMYLAGQACITPHVWLSRKPKLNYPDKLIFDLDPPSNKFKLAVKAAKAIKKIAEKELGLSVFVMTTGSRGLHVVIPLAQKEKFDEVRDFAKKLSEHIASGNPNEFTTELRKEKRKGRLFIDYLRNAYAQTSIMPYAVRAIEQAPVATLLRWDELSSFKNAQVYNIKNIFRRLGKIKDPWEGFFEHAKSISKAARTLQNIK